MVHHAIAHQDHTPDFSPDFRLHQRGNLFPDLLPDQFGELFPFGFSLDGIRYARDDISSMAALPIQFGRRTQDFPCTQINELYYDCGRAQIDSQGIACLLSQPDFRLVGQDLLFALRNTDGQIVRHQAEARQPPRRGR